MPEVIFNGPEGRLEGRYHHSKTPNAPIAILLHPHPQYGGTYEQQGGVPGVPGVHKARFLGAQVQLRGVGRSRGVYDEGWGS